MSVVLEARTAMRQLATKAQEVVVNGDLTNAEKKTSLDIIEADIKAHADTIVMHERAHRMLAGGSDVADEQKDDRPEPLKSFGRQVIESQAYRNVASKNAMQAEVDVKVATTIDEGIIPAFSGGTGLGGQLVAPQLLPGIVPLRFQRLLVSDLFAQGTTTSTSVSYVIESAFQDLTATVLEKGTKPQLDLTLARRQDNVVKIANVAKITDEMFHDAAEFQSYLQNRMMFGVQRVEEAQVLNGTGTAPNLQGILQRSGLAATIVTAVGLTAVKIMEGIYNQITALRSVSFIEPDAVVLHPTDWQTIRLGKDNNLQYYAGGPFTGAYGNGGGGVEETSVWGLRAVITTAIPQGTALVGGFQECAQIFRRQGLTLAMTDSNVDDFVNDLITLRCEERLALAVYRPAGFGRVTLTA